MCIYIVKTGDTVDSIAQHQNVPVETLIYDNQIISPYQLAIGETLFISPSNTNRLSSQIKINGYAYPYISKWVLEETLPYLTELSIFSYGFSMEGDLISPALDEEWMISSAKAYGVQPFLTLTPLDYSGQFNNALISSIVHNSIYQEHLISECIKIMKQKQYAGIDIDFEYIKNEDRDFFTAFVSNITTQMHQNNYSVSIALAPKTSSDQPGLLYEGKDYHSLGNIVDSVLLMTYEWGYKYGPNMAIAPIHMVKKVVDYALTEIPASKIRLGIPNYGYDWPLPYIKGKTVARTIGNIEAVQIAIKHNAIIHFDEISQSPFFNYEENGILHEVWFEDLRSIQTKYELAKSKALSGVGYWQIMRWWRANWLLAEELIKTY